jgi:RNA polymerase subunit RPABC4/transcription elongation factor Spt4
MRHDPGVGGVVHRIQASNKRSPTEEWYGRVMVVGRGCSKCQSKREVLMWNGMVRGVSQLVHNG